MVDHQRINASIVPERLFDEHLFAAFAFKVGLDGKTVELSQFEHERFCRFLRLLIIECDTRAGFHEHANTGCADPARASGDESNFAFQR